jgi:hypothetical protein
MPWRKVIGVAFIAWGVFLTARGMWQWNDAPLEPGRSRYKYFGISRQIEDVSYGPLSILAGIAIYRWGWKI